MFRENQKKSLKKITTDARSDIITKLINILCLTKYPRTLTIADMENMSCSDFKSIFEHLIGIMCPTFRLNDTANEKWDAIIGNILTKIGHKGSLSSTQMNKPTMPYSFPNIISALDFVRRMSRAHINTNPSMMYPLIEELGITSEYIVMSMIRLRDRTKDDNLSSLPKLLEQFTIDLQMRVGVTTVANKQMNELRLQNMESALVEYYDLTNDIQEIDKECAKLNFSIEDKNLSISVSRLSIQRLETEISQEKSKLATLTDKKADTVATIERNAELGYNDKLNEIFERKNNLEVHQLSSKRIKGKLDKIKTSMNAIKMDIQKMRSDGQEELIGLGDFMDEEARHQFANFGINEFLQYDYTLRPLFHRISSAIVTRSDALAVVLNEKKKACEDQDVEYEALAKDLKLVTIQEIECQTELNRVLGVGYELKKSVEALKEERDQLYKDLRREEEKVLLAEREDKELNEKLAIERQKTKDASDFYEADLGFREIEAEATLGSLVSNYKVHKMILEQNNKLLKRDEEILEHLKSEVTRKRKAAVDYHTVEIKKLRERRL